MAKHNQHQQDQFDKLVDAVTKEVTKRLRPTPPAVLLTFRVIRIRAGKMGNVCDLVVSWVPAPSGVKVQHFAVVVTPATAGLTPISLAQDVGPSVADMTVHGVADASSVQASVIEDNGIVQSVALTGSYTVDLTAAPAATAPPDGMFRVTNVRPDDGSTPTLTSPAPPTTPPPAAPEPTATPVAA